MKKLLLAAILAAAATALACGDGSKNSTPASAPPTAAAGNKKGTIYFTKNLDPTGTYSSPCIGIVSTEHIFGDKGKTITWKVKTNGGEPGQDDDCMADLSMVNLKFENSNAVSPNPAYVNSGEITVTVSSNEPDYNGSKLQKYQVYFDATTPAGPDPIIIVNCSSCGPGGGGPDPE